MTASDIYQFNTLTEAVRSLLNSRGCSMQSLAKKLGYSSHRTVGMILSGERKPTLDFVARFARHLKLDAEQKQFLELLLAAERMDSKQEKYATLRNRIEAARKREDFTVIAEPIWGSIHRWPYFVLRQLINTRGFKTDARNIVRKLRHKLTAIEVSKILSDLKGLGLIANDDKGKLYSTPQALCTTTDKPDQFLRKHHREMIALGAEALSAQAVNEREYRALTLVFDRARLVEAKADILAFFKQFNAKYSADELGEDVYQLNLQFFSHTNPTTKDSRWPN